VRGSPALSQLCPPVLGIKAPSLQSLPLCPVSRVLRGSGGSTASAPWVGEASGQIQTIPLACLPSVAESEMTLGPAPEVSIKGIASPRKRGLRDGPAPGPPLQ
jgi:hypothetical protein